MSNETTTINISTSTILRIVVIGLLVWLLFAIRDILVVLLFSLIIASALEPIGRWADRRGFPRMLVILLVYLVVFGLVGYGLSRFVPAIGSDIGALAENIPQYTERLAQNVEAFRDASSRYYDFAGALQGFLNEMGSRLQQLTERGIQGVVEVFGGIISVISILVISFYMAAQRGGVHRVIRSVTPRKHEAYVLDLWHRAQHKLGRWLQAQLVLGFIVGLLSWIGLTILGVPFALVLAIIAGVLELVPYVGPVIAAIPAALVALFTSPILALYVILLYVLVQQFENHVLVPAIMGRAVQLSPVTVIVALLIGGKLMGLIGVILAVPVAAVIAEFVRDFDRFRKEEPSRSNRERLLQNE